MVGLKSVFMLGCQSGCQLWGWNELGEWCIGSNHIETLYILYFWPHCQDGPYHSDSTASRLLSEVKHCRVELVLRWGTTLESSMFIFCLLFSCLKFVGVCCLLSLLGGGLVAAGDPLLSFPSSLFSSLICAFVDSFVVFLEALEAVDVGHDGGWAKR